MEQHFSESPGGLVTAQIAGRTSRASHAGLRWAWTICISKPPGKGVHTLRTGVIPEEEEGNYNGQTMSKIWTQVNGGRNDRYPYQFKLFANH